jgi:hypothetical protein
LLKAIFAEGLFIAIYIATILIGTEAIAMSTLLIILTLITISADPIFTILIAEALIVLPTISNYIATASIAMEHFNLIISGIYFFHFAEGILLIFGRHFNDWILI